ncbi:hypothetical protein M011DRAFT_174214 [Sporormia fimetaria CBS 119925]|uniref:Secreted protein n=1 Tax=Sporormia fimetaria CBS 119925 TaxID=1340428 RepID=A0A6A6VLX6_9PLEO|nr:hypothetical protein M011DRAFT_174214 [Sporormia fimetaria CBS 119925]
MILGIITCIILLLLSSSRQTRNTWKRVRAVLDSCILTHNITWYQVPSIQRRVFIYFLGPTVSARQIFHLATGTDDGLRQQVRETISSPCFFSGECDDEQHHHCPFFY